MFSEWTLVSASIPSGNYLQVPYLTSADHSKFWGAGVGLFPGLREGRMLLYLQCFVSVSAPKDFCHLREITNEYIHLWVWVFLPPSLILVLWDSSFGLLICFTL